MHVVSKGPRCLSTTRSMSLKQPRQRQSCFYSSISICAQSSWPLKHQTPALGTKFCQQWWCWWHTLFHYEYFKFFKFLIPYSWFIDSPAFQELTYTLTTCPGSSTVHLPFTLWALYLACLELHMWGCLVHQGKRRMNNVLLKKLGIKYRISLCL